MKRVLAWLLAVAGLAAPTTVGASTITYGERASWMLATTGITTIDFEGVPTGSATLLPVPPGHTVAGVTFTVASGDLYLIDPACCLPYAPTDVLSSQGSIFPNFRIMLPAGISSIALDYNTDFLREMSLGVTTSSGTSTYVLTPAIRPDLAFFGLTSSESITALSLDLLPPEGAGFLNLDNFAFGAASAIPEPSSLFLLGAGWVTTVLVRRRRLRRST